MFGKKNLIVNSEICDARRINEEDYAGYENILINTEVMFVDERSKGLLARLPATVNAEQTLLFPPDLPIDLRTLNGAAVLGDDPTVGENTVFVVTGSLQLQPGALNTVSRCRAFVVTGALRCPQSMSGCVGKMNVTGSVELYPDDAVILDEEFVMDRFFPLRVKQDALYYAARRITVVDPALDADKLAAKNTRFVTKELVAAEPLVEALAPLFGADSAFTVVPQGCSIVPDSAVLDDDLIRKHGGSLYVLGDLDVPAGSLEAIGKVERLIVTGCVFLARSCKAAFETLNAQCGSVEFVRSKVIGNSSVLAVDSCLLDSTPDGVTVKNAAVIHVHPDVQPETILEKLEIKNAAVIKCTPEQHGAVALVAKNCAHISSGEDGKSEGPGSMLSGLLGGAKALLGTKMVNAESYVL